MAAILSHEARPAGNVWRGPLVGLGLLWLALLLMYRETAAGMVLIWARSDTFAHGFLVVPISAWLVWRGRDRFRYLQPAPELCWGLGLMLAALAWTLGTVASANAAAQFALVAMLIFAVPLTLGRAVARVVLFPLLFLAFGVPAGEIMTDPMMLWTADFTVAALRLSGVPVYREGLNFMIPSGNWSVVEACSGVRYLIASVMVGSLFAYLNYQLLTRRLVFVGVSILVPIVANWFRAYMIVMLGHLSDNRIATGVDHLVYGWVFFGVVITIMFMVGARWAEPDRAPESGAGAAYTRPSPATQQWILLGTMSALALMGPPFAVAQIQAGVSSAPVNLPAFVMPLGGWERAEGPAAWEPRFVGPSGRMNVAYRKGGDTVNLYVGFYRRQGEAGKLVSSVNMLVPMTESPWAPLAQAVRSLELDGKPLQWETTTLVHRGGGISAQRKQMVAWQAYWVDGQWVTSDGQAKWLGLVSKLSGRGDDGAVVVVSAEGEGADGRVAAFLSAHLSELSKTLQAASQKR